MRTLWYEKREFNKFTELESLCILLQSIAHIADQFYQKDGDESNKWLQQSFITVFDSLQDAVSSLSKRKQIEESQLTRLINDTFIAVNQLLPIAVVKYASQFHFKLEENVLLPDTSGNLSDLLQKFKQPANFDSSILHLEQLAKMENITYDQNHEQDIDRNILFEPLWLVPEQMKYFQQLLRRFDLMGTEILLRLERQILLEFFKDVQDLYTQI